MVHDEEGDVVVLPVTAGDKVLGLIGNDVDRDALYLARSDRVPGLVGRDVVVLRQYGAYVDNRDY
eukprot:9613175-Heterocapsa_arctica.AAC.1